MCKYCKMTKDKVCGEKICLKRLAKVTDGFYESEIVYWKYDGRGIEGGRKEHKLILNWCAKINGKNIPSTVLKSKELNIKYCPFCGEEL